MNKTIWRPLLDAVFYLFIFIILQIAATLICGAIAPVSPDGINATVYGTIVSSIIVLALFAWRKWSPPVADYLQQRPWNVFLWVATASIGAMGISDAIVGAMDLQMPEGFARIFAGVMNHPLGYIAVGILAPVAEEMVFRGGILRCLLKAFEGKNHWFAIVFSALLFGLVHGNWAQGVNAFLLGLLLGWLYYRTDSVVPGIILHWVNNTIAYVLFKLMPGMADMTLLDLCGGDTIKIVFYVACSLCVLLPSLLQLNLRLKKS